MKDDKIIKKLMNMPYQALIPKVIENALKLGIFDELKTPLTAKELADIKNWHENNTEIFLQALFALDYLKKNNNAYENSDEVNRYLVKNSDEYAGTLLLFYGQDLAGVFPDDFTKLLKDGPPSMEEIMQENMKIDFAALENIMREHQSGLQFVEVKNILESIPEFKTAKKILDLGCGVGMTGINMGKINNTSEIVLYDMPQMQGAIERSVEACDFANRIKIMTGDFNSDDIGNNYDFIYSSKSVYAAKHDIDSFMKKIYNALNPGGVFICIADGIEKDHSGPWDMILSWMVYRMKGMDMETPKDLVKNAAINIGFMEIKKETKKMLEGTMDIDILKKA